MKRPLKRLSRILVMLTTVAVLAAACGDSSSTATVGVGAGPTTPTTAPPVTNPPTTTPGLPPVSGPYPIADITVTIHPEGIDSAPSATYRLNCLGDTATLTGNANATAPTLCEALDRPEVHQLLVVGPPTDRMCTQIYGGPNTATITGTLDSNPVDFTATRDNGCSIEEWDSILIDLVG